MGLISQSAQNPRPAPPTQVNLAPKPPTAADLEAAWDRLQAARAAVGAAFARFRREPSPESRDRLRDAAQEDSDAWAEYARLCQHHREAQYG